MARYAEPNGKVKDVESLRSLDVAVKSAVVGNDLYLRHLNPDGTYGGFVANTAFVSIDSFIGKQALVIDSARVLGNSKITGKSTIKDDAKVIDSTIAGSSTVDEEAQVIKSIVTMTSTITGKSMIKDSIVSFDAYVTGSIVENSAIGLGRFLVDISVKGNKFEGYIKEGPDGAAWVYATLWAPLRRIE